MEPSHGLNLLDYSVVSIILLSGLLALMRGFVREVLSLTAWIGAYFIAASNYKRLEPWTHQWVHNPNGAIALAAVIIFIVSLTILTLIGWLIARLVRGKTLTSIDRSLGFLFGLVRGVLVVCLVYLGATYIPWLNMDKLDKADAAPQLDISAQPPPGGAEKDKEAANNEPDTPPPWLVEARTRPALAYGANILKAYIPTKEIEKTMQEYDDKYNNDRNAATQKAIDDAKTQDMIGIPGKSPPPPEANTAGPTAPATPAPNPTASPAYNSQDRSNLNNLVNQKSNQ